MTYPTTILCPSGSSEYPRRFLDLADPPARLWHRGAAEVLEAPTVALIGSRSANEAGLQSARSLGAALASQGVVVVTGGSLGIETAALDGALQAQGRALVVLSTPIDRPGPAENRGRFARSLALGGAMISEAQSGARFHAARRNRLVAAISDMVVLVQAGLQSGTRHTIRAAQRLGRPLGALSWRASDPGEACVALIQAGATLVSSAQDILRIIGPVERAQPTLGPEHAEDRRLLRQLAQRPLTMEELSERMSMDLQQTLAWVTEMELEGLVEIRGGRCWSSLADLPSDGRSAQI